MSSGRAKLDVASEERRLITWLQYIIEHVGKDVPDTLERVFRIFRFDVNNQTKTELLTCISRAKATFRTVYNSLSLFEKNLRCPSQENSMLLQLSFSQRNISEPNDPFSPENVDNILNDESSPCFYSETGTNKANIREYTTDQERAKEPSHVKQHPNVEELKDDNRSLRKQLASLKMKNHQYEESLFQLGKLSVEENAKRNEERKSELFSKIYHSSSSGTKPSLASTSNGRFSPSLIVRSPLAKGERSGVSFSGGNPTNCRPDSRNSSNRFTEAQATNESVVLANQAASNQQHPRGAEAMVKKRNHQLEKDVGSNVPTSKGNAKNEKDEAANMTRASDLPSTSQQSYDLSCADERDDSRMQSSSLSTIQPSPDATTLYNNYKLLLLTLAQRLLASDVVMLKDWAAQNFSIENPQNATDVLFQLDEKRVINASDLSRLFDFFESIIRFDLVHIIDAFLLGDYDLLRQTPASETRNGSGAQNSQHGTMATSRNLNPGRLSIHPTASDASQGSEGRNPTTSRPPENSGGISNSVLQQTEQTAFQNSSEEISMCNPAAVSSLARWCRGTAGGHSTSNFLNVGPSQNEDVVQEFNWLCSHYKRHCLSQFECCEKFWPCHRCHDNPGTCSQRKLQPRDTKMVKCKQCNKVQKFSPICSHCHSKFAQYYCGLCKHLTGTNDHPYHCEKCGICRIHQDRSFHCDVCGRCFEKRYRRLHECHDMCCVCLKEAITQSLMLPCRHKVHHRCLAQITRMGIITCGCCGKSVRKETYMTPSLT